MRFGILILLLVPLAAFHWLGDERVDAEAFEDLGVPEAIVRPAMLVGLASGRPPAVASEAVFVSVRGRLVGPKGRPLPGARVLARRWEDDLVVASTVTDPGGRFRLGAPFDGMLDVVADPIGRAQVWIEDEDLRDTRIRVHPGRPLRGHVLDPEGMRGVADALVVMEADEFAMLETRTKADGSFTFPMVPTEQPFDLVVDAGPVGRVGLYDLRHVAGVDLEVVLDVLHAVEGRVVRRDENGQKIPVPEVPVQACEKGRPDGGAVRTDEHGAFRCLVCAWGGTLRVRSGRWCVEGCDPRYLDRGSVEIVVRPRISASGCCVGPDGLPVEGAEVEIDGGFCRCSVLTDAHGRFRFDGLDVPEKGRDVEVRKGDLIGETHVHATDCEDVLVQLERTASVRGRVLDARGRPRPESWITVTWVPDPVEEPNDEASTYELTDGAGFFWVGGMREGPCRVRITSGGFEEEVRHDVPARVGGTDLGAIRLRRLAERSGRLVDEQGAPIPTGGFETDVGPGRWEPVDAEGFFVARVPAEDAYDIAFHAPGFLGRNFEDQELPDSGLWTIVMTRAPTIEGRVLDEAGEPVISARVEAEGLGFEDTGCIRTDLDGKFRLEVPVPGRYAVSVHAQDLEFAEDLEIESGTRDVVIRALRLPSIEGRIVDPYGRGIVGAWVRVVRCGEKSFRDTWRERSDAGGRFRVAGLEGETFSVWADALPPDQCVRRIEDVPGFTTGLVVQVVPALVVRGRVLYADGAAVNRGSVVARPVGHDAPTCYGTSTADGTWCVEGLLRGRYAIDASRRVFRGRIHSPVVEARAGSNGVVLVLAPDEETCPSR